MKDLIRQYLQQRGCPTHVQDAGLAGLIETWETVVTEVSHGYDLTLDDYRNDMDGRQLIEELKPLAKSAAHKAMFKKLLRLDAIMRTLIVTREPHCGEIQLRRRGGGHRTGTGGTSPNPEIPARLAKRP